MRGETEIINQRVLVPRALFLDVDRCMYDTEAGFRLVVEATDRATDYKQDDFLEAYRQSKLERRSFNYVSEINRKLGERAYQEVVRPAFLEAAAEKNLRMPGADRIIEYALSSGLPTAFLTFGYADPDHTSQAWQDAHDGQEDKVRAAGFDEHPFLICDEIRKGDLVSKWVDQGKLLVPAQLSPWEQEYLADEAILVDDKTTSFVNKPAQLKGIHVVPTSSNNTIVAQSGYVPQGVVSVVGLEEALGALKSMNIDK